VVCLANLIFPGSVAVGGQNRKPRVSKVSSGSSDFVSMLLGADVCATDGAALDSQVAFNGLRSSVFPEKLRREWDGNGA